MWDRSLQAFSTSSAERAKGVSQPTSNQRESHSQAQLAKGNRDIFNIGFIHN